MKKLAFTLTIAVLAISINAQNACYIINTKKCELCTNNSEGKTGIKYVIPVGGIKVAHV